MKNWIDKINGMNNVFLYGSFVLFAFFMVHPFYGQDSPMSQEIIVPPPFIAKTSRFMAMAFQLDAEEAQKLVPTDVIVKRNDNGQVNGSLEIYTTDQAYGIPNYSIAFFSVEVVISVGDIEKEGNWPVWGVMDNASALASFKKLFNFPYQYSNNITLDSDGQVQKAIIGNQDGGFELTLERKADMPVKAEGLASILSKLENGNPIGIEIPWLAEGHQAQTLMFKITSGSNEALKILSNAKPYYAQVSSNVFSYAKPSEIN